MHFTYRNQPAEDLAQGDVLTRTPELELVLKQFHPVYHTNTRNTHFLVLTQSCDLVRRNGTCASRYITLAAVRPLRDAVDREVRPELEPRLQNVIAAGSQRSRSKLEMFLQRLLNNNESEYFFLRQEISVGLLSDSCAFLRLSIPLKVEHYDTCRAARVLQLTENFQAKLGWLVGQMYSRVGTQDWPHSEMQKRVSDELQAADVVWLEQKALDSLVQKVHEWQQHNPGSQVPNDTINDFVKSLPKARREEIYSRLREVITSAPKIRDGLASGTFTQKDVDKVLNAIRADSKLSALLK